MRTRLMSVPDPLFAITVTVFWRSTQGYAAACEPPRFLRCESVPHARGFKLPLGTSPALFIKAFDFYSAP